MDKSNEEFPKDPVQPCTNQSTGAICATEEVGTEHASTRKVRLSSITPATSTPDLPHDSIQTLAPPETQIPHVPNQAALALYYNGYADL